MKKPAITLALLVVFKLASAQRWNTSPQYGTNSSTAVIDALGRPIAATDITKMNGTSEIYNEWIPGQVTLENGENYKNLFLKFDPKENLLTFVYDKKDAPQKFKDNVRVFTLNAGTERVFANGFPKFDGSNTQTYYEIIAGGKTMLLEHHRQYLKSVRDENRALTIGEYTALKHYYVFKDQKMSKTKLDRNAILAALADKSAEVSAYADKEHLKYDNEEDVKKIFDYYNKL
ncbi:MULTISPECIES: hypothetical protein [unclassified Mucilaginibacter]|uniref:hypothetical protein n=1 Tax=unclassified Mucilaginibacter TaxID=2617802 RepID=UPI000961D015|nr:MULTISPECIES: hypothetical protein [unclassified Mucilaginibacter]OJW14960.1 MAG: hypothetical protein BGO48_12410 [Mucilaginibacter sp. 44-25]PLW88947.1 MAG: hypothetical protein C0154_14090 [Mucilaginibacter sp.]HEK21420.1 hypothetical protein [Bacteroidota bacterium]